MMIRYLLCSVFFFCVFGLFAQKESSNKFQFGITLAPELNLSSLETDNFFFTQAYAGSGWNIGVKSRYRLNQKLAFESGIMFHQRNHDFSIFGLIFPAQIDPLSSFVETTSIEEKINLDLISVPISAIYSISENWIISIGLSLDFYTKKERIRNIMNLIPEEEEALNESSTELETSPFAISFGFGRVFNFRKIDLDVRPILYYNFNKIEIPFENKSDQQLNIGFGATMWFK